MRVGRNTKSRAIAYAVVLHLLVLLVLVSSTGMESNPSPSLAPTVPIIKAHAVAQTDLDKQVKRRQDAVAKNRREAEKKAAEAEKTRRDEEKKKLAALNEARARREAKEKQRIAAQKAEERLAERKRMAAREQRIAKEKRHAEENRRKLEEKAARKAAEKSAEALRLALAGEEEERAATRQQRADDAEIARYVDAVRTRVAGVFIYPDFREGLICTLVVRMIPGGEVVEARVIQSSGNAAFDRQAENAVRKASPLPVPSDPRLFKRMREIKFVFDPEQ